MEESRSGQQSTKDNAHALSLVHLLSVSALRVRDEPPGSSLLGDNKPLKGSSILTITGIHSHMMRQALVDGCIRVRRIRGCIC